MEFGKKSKDVRLKFGVSEGEIKRWVHSYRNTGKVHDSGGRPALLSPAVAKRIKAEVSNNRFEKTESEVANIIQNAINQERLSNSRLAECSLPRISTRFMGRIQKAVGFVSGRAEQMTDARALACACKFNAICTAVAHFFMMLLTVPHLTFNADGTSFQTGGGLSELVKVRYLPEDFESKGGPLKVAAQKGQSLVCFFIKVYIFINAFGNSGPVTFILDDGNMVENTIDVHEVYGLGVGTELTTKAYLVFCKTRSANMEFYRWFFEDVFVKFVIDSRTIYKIDLSVPAYFWLDGESDQINPLKEKRVIEICEEFNIIIGKPPASTTSKTQPLDAGTVFLSAKNINRGLRKPEDKNKYMDSAMSDTLKKVIIEHEARIGHPFPAAHKNLLTNGVQQVRYLLVNSMQPKRIKDSFIDRAVGLY